MTANINDLASETGVSPSTVSFALHNEQQRVSIEVLDSVLQPAKRLKYEPNSVARGLSHKHMDAPGIVYTYWATDDVNLYLTNTLHGIIGPAMTNRQKVILFTANLWEEITGSITRIGDWH